MQQDELKEILTQTLESQGVLAKLRSELRKQVFMAIESQQSQSESNTTTVDSIKKSNVGTLLLEVLDDALEYLELDYTQSMFRTEAKMPASKPPSERKEIRQTLHLPQASASSCILVDLIRQAQENKVGTEKKAESMLPLIAKPLFPSAIIAPFVSTEIVEADTEDPSVDDSFENNFDHVEEVNPL